MKGHLEPSDHLIDICCGIYEENRLKYVEWSKCTSRESELQCDPTKDASYESSNRMPSSPRGWAVPCPFLGGSKPGTLSLTIFYWMEMVKQPFFK